MMDKEILRPFKKNIFGDINPEVVQEIYKHEMLFPGCDPGVEMPYEALNVRILPFKQLIQDFNSKIR